MPRNYEKAVQKGAVDTNNMMVLFDWSNFRFYGTIGPDSEDEIYVVVKYHPDGNVYYYHVSAMAMLDLMALYHWANKDFLAGIMSTTLELMNIKST